MPPNYGNEILIPFLSGSHGMTDEKIPLAEMREHIDSIDRQIQQLISRCMADTAVHDVRETAASVRVLGSYPVALA